jgi:hypothetical protein
MTEQFLLLGGDMELSPATQALLQVARSLLLERAPQGQQALLLTAIPVPFHCTRRLLRSANGYTARSLGRSVRPSSGCVIQGRSILKSCVRWNGNSTWGNSARGREIIEREGMSVEASLLLHVRGWLP